MERKKVPNIVGVSLDEAKEILEKANIEIEKEKKKIDIFEKSGTVVKVEPKEETSLKKNEKVVLYVSDRKPILIIILLFLLCALFMIVRKGTISTLINTTSPVIESKTHEWTKTGMVVVTKDAKMIDELKNYEYCVTNKKSTIGCNWQITETKNAEIVASGKWYVYFRGIDVRGRRSKVSNREYVQVDNENPVVKKIKEEVTENTIKVTIEATDRLSGVNSYFYKIDNQEYVLGTKTHEYKNLEANKEYKITIKVVDKVGNEIEVSKKIRTKNNQSNSGGVINPTTEVTTSTKVTTTKKIKEIEEVIEPPYIDLNEVPSIMDYKEDHKLPSNYDFKNSTGTVSCKVGNIEYTNTKDLELGEHTITCTATNKEGISTTVSKKVTVRITESDEEEWDGWIWLNLHYPPNSTKWEWKMLDDNSQLADDDLLWHEYTGPIRVRIEDVDKIVIRYVIDGNEIIISPDGYYVDIEPEKANVKAGEVTKVKINYSNNVEKVEYRINNGVWQDYTNEFEVGPNTSIEARIRYSIDVFDDEGNLLLQQPKKKTASGYIGEIIDPSSSNQPVICTTCSCVTGSYDVKIIPTSSYINNNQPVQVKIEYEDGATLKQYKIGLTGTWQNYTGEIMVNRNQVIYARASGYKEINGCTKWVSGEDMLDFNYKWYGISINPEKSSLDSTETTTVWIGTWLDSQRLSLEYSINGGDFKSYTSSFTVGPNTTITARATWKLDNGTIFSRQESKTIYENTNGLRVYINPTTNKTSGLDKAYITLNTNYKADKIEYTLDNGASWTDYKGIFGVDAKTNICAKATKTNTNGAIQTSPMSCLYIDEDDLGLKITPSSSGARKGKYVTATIGTYYKVEKIEYSLDNGSTWNEYTGTNIPVQAGSEIQARATYKGKVITTSLKIDILPEPSVALDGPDIIASPDTTLSPSVAITINTADVARDIFYRINRGSWIKYTGIFNVTSNVKIEAYYVRDEDGKTSATSTYYVQNVHVGNKPYVRIDTEPKGYLINGTQDKVKVKISGSNYNTLEYSLDGINYQPYTNEFEVTTSLTVYARATNDVGTTTTQFTIVTVNPPKVWKNLSVKIVANPDSKDLIDKDGNVKLVNETKVSLVYGSDVTSACYKVLNAANSSLTNLNQTNSNQTNALANQPCIPYTGAFKVNKNSTIYAYVQSADGKGTDVKLIDFLTLGIASPVINVDQTSATSTVKVNIDYARTAEIMRYRIDNGPWIDYTGEIEVTANCTIEAMNEDILGNRATSSLTINNIVRKPVYNILDKGDYYLIKLNYPSNSIESSREYKWKSDGTWKKYDEHGILLIKPSAASKIVTPDGVKIKDDSGKEIIFTDHYYILDVDVDKVGENLYMNWDMQKVEAPKIIVSEEEETVTSVDVAVSYNKALVSKLYRVIYDNGTDTGWLKYNGKFKVTDKGIVYAKGVDIDGNDSKVAEQRIDNIDSTGPVITVTGDLVTPKQKVTLLISAKDDGEVDSLLYEVGSKNAAYFKKNGKGLKNPSTITIEENGKYTFYAVDGLGNETIKEIEITNIDKTAPDIEITVLSTTVGTSTEVEINYGDAVTTLYKVGETGTYQSYTGKFTLSSYDLFNLKNEDGSLTIYAKGIDQAGNEEEVKEITYVLDLDAPKEPTIVAGALYPTLTEYGVKLGSKSYITYDSTIADATNYYSIDNGATWKVYTGPFNITSGTIKAKTVKNKSGLTIEVTKQVDMPTDVLGPEAYDNDDQTYVDIGHSKHNIMYISKEMMNKSFYLKIYRDTGVYDYIYLYFYDSNNKIISSIKWSREHSDYANIKIDIPDGCTRISLYNASTYANGVRVANVTVVNDPIISATKVYPKITQYGIENGYNEVTIDYFSTSVQRLYRINGQQWKNYMDKTIQLKIGDKLEAKGIDKNGVDSNVVSYDSILPDDALGKEAYDNDDQTYVDIGHSKHNIMNISNELQGKAFYINILRNTGNYDYIYLYLYDNNGKILNTIKWSRDYSGYVNIKIDIPDGCSRMSVYNGSTYANGVRVSNISVAAEPSILPVKYYPTLTEYGINYGYNLVTIDYFPTSIKKLYRINSGEWKDYENEPIRLEIGDKIEAMGINRNSQNSLITSYDAVLPTNALNRNAYDDDESTSVSNGTYNINIADSLIGKYVSFKYTEGDKSAFRPNATMTVSLLDKNGNELFSKDYSFVSVNILEEQIKILPGTAKMKFYLPVTNSSYGPNRALICEVFPEITPIISQQNYYTTIKQVDISKSYINVEISYLSYFAKKLYSLDNGSTWLDYTEPIKVNVGDVIQAKAIDKDGNETTISKYTVKGLTDNLDDKAFDKDQTTSVTLSSKQTKFFSLDNVDNEVLRIYTTGKVNAGAYIKLYGKDNQELSTVTLNTDLTTLVIPEGSVKASIYSGTSTLTINEVNLREVKATKEKYPEITINDTNWTTTKTVEILYPEGTEREYSLDLGTTWNKYTNELTIDKETTIFARSIKDGKIISTNSYVITTVDNEEPIVELDIPEEVTQNDSYTLPTKSTFGKSGGTVVCKVNDKEVKNTNELEEGENTITCVATSVSGKTSEMSKTISLIKVSSLKDALMSREIITTEPTLTTSSNNSNDKSGLYKSNVTNSGKTTYYFRGDVQNNYVSFAGNIWRIVRINEDGTIRLIMQNGINDNQSYVFNSNYSDYSKMYYSNSEAKTTLENWYNTNIGNNENYSKHVVNGSYYCEQAKVKFSSAWTSGSATMEEYTNYTPTFKCEMDGNGYGLVNSSIGLLTYDEAVFAGGYWESENHNYYLNNQNYFWTLSPAGYSGTYSSDWTIYPAGSICDSALFGKRVLRPVINLKSDTVMVGTGTSADPYVVK